MVARVVARALRPFRPFSSQMRSMASASYQRTAPKPAAPRYAARATTTTTTKAAPAKTTAAPAAAPAATPSPDISTTKPEFPPGVLDPQAAIPPAPVATISSAFEPVPPPAASISSALNSAGEGGSGDTIDWSASYHGLAQTPFSAEAAAILMAPLDPEDVEVKPDGIIYLPEIKYRRILNRAFGPGGWGLAPRGDLIVGDKIVTREYALVAHGRFVALARGECQYFSDDNIPTAGEGCKSNALMRCCKDLGIGSELWDPRFIRNFKKQYAKEIWVEHVVNKKKRQVWIAKDGEPAYPYKKV